MKVLIGFFFAASCVSLASCGMTSVFSPGAYLDGAGVEAMDLSAASPGTYSGRYDLVLPPGVFAKNRRFDVTVVIGASLDVDVTINEPSPLSGIGEESTRELNDDIAAMIGRIETARAIPVDGVSGATWSSLALLKAIEEAMTP